MGRGPAGARPRTDLPTGSVLVVGHDASRTGAPAALLRALAPLVAAGLDGRIVLRAGGPLLDAHRAVLPTSVLAGRLGRAVDQVASGLRSVGWPHPAPAAERRARRAPVAPTAAVLANTLAALPTATALAPIGVALVCWCHELDGVADRVLPAGPGREAAVGRVDHWVAAGPWVADMLVGRWGVAPELVSTAWEPIPAVPSPGPTPAVLGDLAARGPLVVGVGEPGPRKGTDLFVALLADLVGRAGRAGTVTGAWVGGTPGTTAWTELAHDLAAAGLGGRVVAVPTVADAGPALAAATVVVGTAREDPCPLGLLEAAAVGRPLALLRTGGAADLVAEAGHPELVAAPFDVLGLADRVDDLLAPGRAEAVGADLAAHVRRVAHPDVVADALALALATARARVGAT